MRPIRNGTWDILLLVSRYFTFSPRVPKIDFCPKSPPKNFYIKNQPKTRCWHCFWSQKWISSKSVEFWNLGNKKFSTSILIYFDTPCNKSKILVTRLQNWLGIEIYIDLIETNYIVYITDFYGKILRINLIY